jgi:hypothetical protein
MVPMRITAPLALVVIAARPAALPAKELAAPPLPCGIADPTGRTGFLANPSGKIDAIDLVTGDVLWTADARRPLFAAGERLYALTADGHQPRLRAFDLTNRGGRVFESEALTLPEWASVVDGPNHLFAVHSRMEKADLVLSWVARQPRENREAAGTVRVAARTGEITTAATELPAPDPACHFMRELETLAVRWHGVSGGDFKALVLEQEGERQKLVLHSWDRTSGTAKAPREFLTGKRLNVLPTLDDRFLLLRDAAGAEATRPAAWSIFAVATGDPAGQAPFEAGTQAAALIGSRGYFLLSGPIRGPIHRGFVHPRLLRAVDLKTGKTLWERPVEGKVVTPP